MARSSRGPLAGLGAVLLLGCLVAPEATAHPVNMSFVEHQYRLRVAPDGIVVSVFLRYYEFPSLTQRLRMDADGNAVVTEDERKAYARRLGKEMLGKLVLEVDGARVALREDYPAVVDLMGHEQVVPRHHEQWSVFSASVHAPPGTPVTVSLETRLFADNPGFFRHTVDGEGVTILESSVVEQPEVDRDLGLPPGPEVRRIEFTYRLAEPSAEPPPAAPAPATATAAPAPERGARPDTFMVGLRVFQDRVSAYFRGEFRLWAFVALLAGAFVYGGFHALAPGHAKTITAAYLIGSHATPWHAVLLGVVVTVSHTWSIYALALVTHWVYGGEVQAETHGLVMAASGGLIALLGIGQFVGRLRGRSFLGHSHGPDGHTHVHPHDHPHDHEHPHAHEHPHVHEHVHGHPHDHAHEHAHDHQHHQPVAHSHDHAADAAGAGGGITMKSLVLLGFSGGIVPCPGALWIYFLALSLHRTFEGVLLITALGAGLATVLTAVGLITVRVRRRLLRGGTESGTRLGRVAARLAGWLGRWIGLIGPCIIAAMGLLLVAWGLLSAGLLGRG